MPTDRAEIDHRARTRLPQRRHRGLRDEEQMAQVDRHSLVPVSGGDLLRSMAVVIGGVVDEDVEAAKCADECGYRFGDVVELGEVKLAELWRMRRPG